MISRTGARRSLDSGRGSAWLGPAAYQMVRYPVCGRGAREKSDIHKRIRIVALGVRRGVIASYHLVAAATCFVIVWESKLPLSLAGITGPLQLSYVLLLAVGIGSITAWALGSRERNSDRPANAVDLSLRLVFALLLMNYGVAKLLGNQFNTSGATLDMPLRDLSGFQLAWRFFGYSRTYEVFVAAAEIAAAVLVLVPRTALLGGLIGFAVMANVAVVDYSFGILSPLPLAVTLLLAALLIIAVRAQNLRPMLATPPVGERQTGQWQRALVGAGVVFALALPIYRHLDTALGRPTTSPLYGRWTVDLCTGGVPLELCGHRVDTIPSVMYFERWGFGGATLASAERRVGFEYAFEEDLGALELKILSGDQHRFLGHYDGGSSRVVLVKGGSGADTVILKRSADGTGPWPLDRLRTQLRSTSTSNRR
jgi:hypothetical protein